MYGVLTGQEKKRHFGLIRLHLERPSPTILGDTGCTTAGSVHPYEIRKLTITEIKALASYLREFQPVGSYRAGRARIVRSAGRCSVDQALQAGFTNVGLTLIIQVRSVTLVHHREPVVRRTRLAACLPVYHGPAAVHRVPTT